MNALCYGSLCASAEVSQQTIKYYVTEVKRIKYDHIVNHGVKYDIAPIKRIALWGTLVIGPIYTKWYAWLEKTCGAAISRRMLLRKIFFDQFIFTPPVLAMFFGTMAALEYIHHSGYDPLAAVWHNMKTEVKTKVPAVFLADCAFWIPVQAFNFAYVPFTWRVPFIGVMTFVWLNILCFAKSFRVVYNNNK